VIHSLNNNGAAIKIRNFQALIDKGYSHNKDFPVEHDGTNEEDTLTKGMVKLNL
jgi:hypothetical protein